MNYPNIATHLLRNEEIKFNLKELNKEILLLKYNINDMILLPITQTQNEYLSNPLFLDLCNVLNLTPQQVNELQVFIYLFNLLFIYLYYYKIEYITFMFNLSKRL